MCVCVHASRCVYANMIQSFIVVSSVVCACVCVCVCMSVCVCVCLRAMCMCVFSGKSLELRIE